MQRQRSFFNFAATVELAAIGAAVGAGLPQVTERPHRFGEPSEG